MLRRADPERGVTLIELMIGLAIVAIVLALGVPSFSVWIQNSRLRNAAESILSGMQLARAEAVTRNAPVRFVLGTGSEWTVGCVNATATCPATIQKRAAGDGSSGTISVTAAQGKTITFDVLGRMSAPVLPAGTVAATFDVDSSALAEDDSRDLRITVNAAGGIRMCDPHVTGSDVRAC